MLWFVILLIAIVIVLMALLIMNRRKASITVQADPGKEESVERDPKKAESAIAPMPVKVLPGRVHKTAKQVRSDQIHLSDLPKLTPKRSVPKLQTSKKELDRLPAGSKVDEVPLEINIKVDKIFDWDDN